MRAYRDNITPSKRGGKSQIYLLLRTDIPNYMWRPSSKKCSARQYFHYPCSCYLCITKNNGTAFPSNYPTNLPAPSPQLFNLVRFGHECLLPDHTTEMSVSGRDYRSVQSLTYFELLVHSINLQLDYISSLCSLLDAEEEMWTGIENVRCHTPGIWKTSTAAILSPPTETLKVNVWRALSKVVLEHL